MLRLSLKDIPVRASRCGCPSEDEHRTLMPLMGFIESPPRRHKHCASTPSQRTDLRHGAAKPRTCSALAVPPGFDGLLRAAFCRFVAPCSRPWGSFSFRPPPKRRPSPERDTLRSFPLPVSLHTSPGSPPFTAFRAPSLLLPALFTAPRCRAEVRLVRNLSHEALLRQKVRCRHTVLPPHAARYSHGLLD
jgi:hypothetical protein